MAGNANSGRNHRVYLALPFASGFLLDVTHGRVESSSTYEPHARNRGLSALSRRQRPNRSPTLRVLLSGLRTLLVRGHCVTSKRPTQPRDRGSATSESH